MWVCACMWVLCGCGCHACLWTCLHVWVLGMVGGRKQLAHFFFCPVGPSEALTANRLFFLSWQCCQPVSFPAIIITDGLSNVNAEQTIPEAELAKKQGIHIFAIGIGVSDGWELRAIASEPADSNAFMLQQFSDLWNISDKLIDATCKGKTSGLTTMPLWCSSSQIYRNISDKLIDATCKGKTSGPVTKLQQFPCLWSIIFGKSIEATGRVRQTKSLLLPWMCSKASLTAPSQ